jgi:hypothetical protein
LWTTHTPSAKTPTPLTAGASSSPPDAPASHIAAAAVTLGVAIPALIYALTRVGAALYIDCHARGRTFGMSRTTGRPSGRPLLFGVRIFYQQSTRGKYSQANLIADKRKTDSIAAG